VSGRLRGARLTAVLAGILLATTAGCTDETGSDEDPATTGSGERKVLTADAETPWAKEGRDYRVIDRIPSVIDDRMVNYQGTASDGTQVLSRSDLGPDLDQAKADPRGSAVMVRDPATGDAEVVAQHGTTDQWLQDTGITVAGTKAVWIDTPSTSLYEEPWELYVYDTSTGTETHLASHEYFGIENPPMPNLNGVVPHVTDDFVYFPAVDEVRKSDPAGYGRASIYRAPIDGGGDPELIAKGGVGVFGDADPGRLQVRFEDRIVQWDPARGADGEVAGSSLPAPHGSFANEGVRVAYDRDAAWITIESDRHGEFAIDLDSDTNAGYLNATSRWVSFTVDTEGEQQGFLLDLERGRLMRLEGVVNSSTTRLRGNRYDLTPDWEETPPKTFPLIALLPEK